MEISRSYIAPFLKKEPIDMQKFLRTKLEIWKCPIISSVIQCVRLNATLTRDMHTMLNRTVFDSYTHTSINNLSISGINTVKSVVIFFAGGPTQAIFTKKKQRYLNTWHALDFLSHCCLSHHKPITPSHQVIEVDSRDLSFRTLAFPLRRRAFFHILEPKQGLTLGLSSDLRP